MGVLIGFALGYYYGMRAGKEGFEEMLRAWEEIKASEEFQGMVAAATELLNDAGRQVAGSLGDRIKDLLSGRARDTVDKARDRLRAA